MTVEDLVEYGLVAMDDEAIGAFLQTQEVGVLGLRGGDRVPYLLPLAFGFDGDSRLYFTYVLGEESRKGRLTERADRAAFLVFSADAPFLWESVLLSGPIDLVPPGEWADLDVVEDNPWHREVFAAEGTTGRIEVYALAVEERRGLRFTGEPAGLPPRAGDAASGGQE